MMRDDNRLFTNVVTSIANAEKDVDKVLKAAKLSRNPINSRHEMELILETIELVAGMFFGSATVIAIFMILAGAAR